MVPEYVSITTWCIWLQEFRCCREQVALEIAAKKPKIDAHIQWPDMLQAQTWRHISNKAAKFGKCEWLVPESQSEAERNQFFTPNTQQTNRRQNRQNQKVHSDCRWLPVIAGDCRWLPVIAGDCRWLPVIGYIMLHHVSSCCIPAHGHHGPSWPIMAHHGPSWLIGAGLQFHLLQRWQIPELHPGGWQRAAEVQLDILRVQWSHLAQEKIIWNRSFVHPISVIWRGLLVFFLQNQGHQYILEVNSNAFFYMAYTATKKMS